MLRVTLPVVSETCSKLRAISWVAALCSVTAEAMATAISFTCVTVWAMPWMASAVRSATDWIAEICPPISSVALPVCCASVFTSEATTAKPLPASPARAASIVALRASRLVWLAMLLMSLDDGADLLGGGPQFLHAPDDLRGLLHRVGRDPRGSARLPADLVDRGRELLRRGRHRLDRGRGLLDVAHDLARLAAGFARRFLQLGRSAGDADRGLGDRREDAGHAASEEADQLVHFLLAPARGLLLAALLVLHLALLDGILLEDIDGAGHDADLVRAILIGHVDIDACRPPGFSSCW